MSDIRRYVLLLVMLLVPSFTYIHAQDPLQGVTITDVDFEGLRRLKPEQLLQIIESKPGTEFDRMRLRNDLKNLAQRALRVDVRQELTADGLRLIFVLRENPVIADVRFIGNDQIKTSTLEKILRVGEGDVLSREDILETEKVVRREYRILGYMKAHVEVSIIPAKPADPEGPVRMDAAERVILQVFIREGEKVKIDDLKIVGNDHFFDWRIRLEMETSGSWLFFKNYYDEEAFERDLQTIQRMYIQDGFFDVQVTRGEFEFSQKKKTVTPVIRIFEGPRYRIGDISVEGVSIFKPEEVLAPFQKIKGDEFNARPYQLAMEKAKALYGNEGYITTEFADFFEFDRAEGKVNVRISVMEGPQIRVGKVLRERPEWLDSEPEGWFGRLYDGIAPPVKDEVIARETELEPGEIYSLKDEERTEYNLYRLGVFEDVQVENRSTDDPKVHDAAVIVEDGVSGNVFLGAGYRESMGLYAWTALSERNIGGNADVLRMEYTVGTEGSGFSLSYLDRYLAGSDYSLQTRLYHGSADKPGFDQEKTGGSLELGIPLEQVPTIGSAFNDAWRAELGLRAEYVDTDEGEYDPDADFDQEYGVFTGRIGVSHDSRVRERLIGREFFTTKGHYESIGFEGGYANGTLLRLTGRYEWYYPVMDRLIFASENTVGLMAYDADEVGPSERMYMGGGEDMRGFDYNQVGDHDSGDGDVPLGGATRILSRNELRYPIFDVLTGVVFLDAGMIDQRAFTYDATRVSAGGGLRLKVQGVLLGIDIAGPLLYQTEDRKRYFHFYIRGDWGI